MYVQALLDFFNVLGSRFRAEFDTLVEESEQARGESNANSLDCLQIIYNCCLYRSKVPINLNFCIQEESRHGIFCGAATCSHSQMHGVPHADIPTSSTSIILLSLIFL